jgi:hypothetical protein
MMLAPKGAADLTGWIPTGYLHGMRLEVEVKRREGGRQSAKQKEWEQLCLEASVPYIVVASGAEFEEKISHYCPIPATEGKKYYDYIDKLKKEKGVTE